MTKENRRRDARMEACIPVEVVRGRAARVHETLDVSFRGLFLRTTDPPALRSLVRLRVALPSRTIEAHAMAVHLVDRAAEHACGVGLQLWGLAGEGRHAWDAFIRDLVRARRAEAAAAAHPANSEMPTPSGIRAVFSATTEEVIVPHLRRVKIS
jgi:hypothetical protein